MSALARLTALYLRSRQKRLLQVRHPLTPRRLMEHMRWLPLPSHIERERELIAGVPVLRIRNTKLSARPGHVLLYIHGGGFTGGSPGTHASFAARLMQTGAFAEAWLPDYRLAPEHVFPAASNDVMAVWLALTRYTDVSAIALAGESAGGNLALGLATRLRDAQAPLPSRLYLMSPWLDLSFSSGPLSAHFQHDAFCGPHPEKARQWLHEQFARHYLGDMHANHPEVSPVLADLHGLPPIYVQAAANEVFNADSLLLARRCAEAGTACELEIWRGLFHAFALFAPLLPEANTALHLAGRWLRDGRLPRVRRHQDLLIRESVTAPPAPPAASPVHRL